MLLDRSQLADVWARIKAGAAANPDSITVLILVALDVDALASCAILTASTKERSVLWICRAKRLPRHAVPELTARGCICGEAHP